MAVRPNKGYIKLNNSTGSDTTASGCGVNNVNGFGAMWSQASTTINFMQPNSTANMTVGDILWIDAGTGDRQFFEIAAIPSGNAVTTVESTSNSGFSGVAFAVGGTRQTLNGIESTLNYPLENGFIGFELEDNQTVQWNTTLMNTGHRYVFKSSDPNTRRSITHAGGNSYLFPPGARVSAESIIFVPGFSTGMTLGAYNTASGALGGDCQLDFHNCIVGGFVGNSYDYVFNGPGTATGFGRVNASRSLFAQSPFKSKNYVFANNCYFYNTDTLFDDPNSQWGQDAQFYHCILDVKFYSNTGSTSVALAMNQTKLVDCVVKGGQFFAQNWYAFQSLGDYEFAKMHTGNTFVDMAAGPDFPKNVANTNYFNLGSGNNINDTEHPAALASQPFVNTGSQDFNLATSGQGAIDLRDSRGTTFGSTQFYDYRYILDQLPSGGGNVFVIEES